MKLDCRCDKKVETPAAEPIRESSAKRGYDRKWREWRETTWKRIVSSGTIPKCAECGLQFGIESPHFDHIEPVQSADDPNFYDTNNIQFLHLGCHVKKTNRDVRNGKTRSSSRT